MYSLIYCRNMALIAICFASIFMCAHSSRVTQRGPSASTHDGAGNRLQDSAITPDKYIAGGHPAELGQFPSIARLSIKDRTDGSTYLCAGSLISARHVLTAAHCLEHEVKYYQDIGIYLGEYDRRSFPKDCVKGKCTENKLVYPDKITKHPEYDSRTISNDIALLRLKKRAPFSEFIQPIPLPPFDVDTPKNKGVSLAILGWGQTEESRNSNVLLATELSLIPKKECLSQDSDVPAKHLCAGDMTGKDTCPGDSGGPLLMYYNKKYYLSGIVSYGPNVECGTSKIGFYTNVFKYMKWIKANMK